MKCSGMRWSMTGGQAILTLRSLFQSGRWRQAWNLIQAEFCKSVSIVNVQTTDVLYQDTAPLSEVTHVSHFINSIRDYDSLPLAA